MLRTIQNGYSEESQAYEEAMPAETPFADPQLQHVPLHEAYSGETVSSEWEFSSPFVRGESMHGGDSQPAPLEVSEFSEVFSELKDTLFREALEQLADEALEAHSHQLAGEYGDREMRELAAEQLLNEHFQPLAFQAESLLDQFFERVEGYEAESLTDMEIERISNEILPTLVGVTPASEQFLGGLLRKAGKLVSGAVNLAKKGAAGAVKMVGKGLAAVGKLALGPLLEPLKKLARALLGHVVKFALNQLPVSLRPLGQQLADKLMAKIGETSDSSRESETGTLPAAPDAARLEAEFDAHAAQLLVTPNEAEMDHLVSSYGETETYLSPISELDDTRTQLTRELAQLQQSESAQPVIEHFLPALWPAAKAAIAIIGRPKLVGFLGNLLSKLIKPLMGANAASMLSPAIADAGLHVFGLEANAEDSRTLAAEALAATLEETVNTIATLPSHVTENETLLSDAVHEAFENAAASYFPNSVIKPELRESVEQHGMWTRMPAGADKKRYAKYSDTIPVEISPRMAGAIRTFGNKTLEDHFRDHHHGLKKGQGYDGKVTLYQALPGTRGSTIARAEGFPVSQLHPLTPQSAAILGQNASLGRHHHTPDPYLVSPGKLHVNQRLYRIHPNHGQHHHHHHQARSVHSELIINLVRREIRLWLYLSEPLCQQVVTELAGGKNPVSAFGLLKPLLRRASEELTRAIEHRHLPPHIQVVSETPNVDSKAPHWLRHAGHHLAAKIGEWAETHLAQYLRNNAEEFKQACASKHDGVTLRITMTRVPGLDELQLLSQGKDPEAMTQAGWPKGNPAVQIVARAGFAASRLRS